MKDIFQSEFLISIRDGISAFADKLQKIPLLNKKPDKKFIIIAFAAIILFLALFSVITLIDEKAPATDETTSTEIAEVDPALLGETDKEPIRARFLLALTDSEKQNVLSAMVVDLDAENTTMGYYFLSGTSSVFVSGIQDTFNGHLATGGTAQFILAAREYTGVTFDRYLVITEAAFGNLAQKLGETTVHIDSRVSYEHRGVSFIIDEGTQSLTPDMLVKYFIYLISDPQTNGKKIADLLIGLVERITSIEDDAQLEDSFCSALGFCETDISALDFNNNKAFIRSFSEMNISEKAYQLSPESNTEQ